MPNYKGKNGYGEKSGLHRKQHFLSHLLISLLLVPADDVLREALHKYARRGLTRVEKMQALKGDFGYVIG